MVGDSENKKWQDAAEVLTSTPLAIVTFHRMMFANLFQECMPSYSRYTIAQPGRRMESGAKKKKVRK